MILISACDNFDELDQQQKNRELSEEETFYRNAVTEYKANRYLVAIDQFNAQLQKYPNGTFADNAHLYIGRSLYWLLQYNGALQQFSLIFNNFPNSNSMNAAHYWRAKVFHAQNDFVTARAEYLLVASSSTWKDNADYQIAKTYYDEANLPGLSVTDRFSAYLSVSIKFNNWLNQAAYQNSSVKDSVKYYLGRIKQLLAQTIDDPGISVQAINSSDCRSVAQCFSQARALFNELRADVTSNWADEAEYQLGKIHYYEAGIDTATIVEKFTSYLLAGRVFQNWLGNSAYQNSATKDNAQYFSARVKHELAQLIVSPELSAMATNTQDCRSVIECFNQARALYSTVSENLSSSLADDAKYHLGKTYYDLAGTLKKSDPELSFQNYSLAIAEFDVFINSPANSPFHSSNSSRSDSAYYYRGRSFHQQAKLKQLVDSSLASQLHLQARIAYDSTITIDNLGNWADNAQYQIGASFYDEAIYFLSLAEQAIINGDSISNIQLLFSQEQAGLNEAISKFQLIVTDNNYKLLNSADNAQYYLGRSYHLIADIPLEYRIDFSSVNNGINFTAIDYSHARNQYLLLTTSSQYKDSSVWVDNAYFQIATTHYKEADTAIDQAFSYNSALLNYKVVVDSYFNKNLADNAVFQIGLIYHDVQYCLEEQNWFSFLTGMLTVSNTFVNIADVHLNDIDLINPTANHPCGSTIAGVSQSLATPISTASQEAVAYQTGLSLYRRNQFDQAVNQFNNQLTNFPAGSYADDAHYYIGLSNYALAKLNVGVIRENYFANAINKFDLFITDLSPIFTLSDLIDDAQYWLARSYHVRANTGDYLLARTAYSKVPNSSRWYDDAVYQSAKSYYDEATVLQLVINPDLTRILSLYKLARVQFTNAINSNLLAATSIDDAWYYLGRSNFRLAELVSENPNLPNPTSDPTLNITVYLNNAEAAYNNVASGSTLFDDAGYQIGKTYYFAGTTSVFSTSMQNYQKAIDKFNELLAMPSFDDNRLQDSVYYFKARSYYQQAKLVKSDSSGSLSPNKGVDTYFSEARTTFAVIPSNTVTIPSSDWRDAATYYTGRSYQEQLAPDYAQALATFGGLVAQSLSNYADDALFQQGMIHLDEGEAQLDPVVAMQHYNLSLAEFNSFLQKFSAALLVYQNSSRLDAVRYFRGRTLHFQALLVQNDGQPGSLNQLYSDARTAYRSVTQGSSYLDNAQYRLGKSYYDEAAGLVAGSTLDAFNAYQQAALAWNDFTGVMTGTNIADGLLITSSFAQNALYYLGRSRYRQASLIQVDNNLVQTGSNGVVYDDIWHYDQALQAYAGVVINDNLGLYADNAQYRIGKHFYDQAANLLDPIQKLATYQLANDNWSAFSVGGIYHQANRFSHYALYFRGRSYHRQAIMIQTDNSLSNSSNALLDITQRFSNALASYQASVNADINGIYADNSQYQIGKHHYDRAIGLLAVDTQAQAFDAAVKGFQGFANAPLNTSTLAHAALYFQGRSSKQLGDLLYSGVSNIGLSISNASSAYNVGQNAYQNSIIRDAGGIYADNAQYQLGELHYDQAVQAQAIAESALALAVPDTVVAQNAYDTAQQHINAAIIDYQSLIDNYAGSVLEDNTLYYTGRSYHRVMDIPMLYRLDLSGTTGGVDFTTVTYNTSRAYYDIFTTGNTSWGNQHNGSTWLDNAFYQEGISYSSEAFSAVDVASQVNLYNFALQHFQQVLNMAGSIWIDNAANKMGLLYHDTQYCTEEAAAFSYLNNLSPVSSTLQISAQLHMDDLVLASPQVHNCVPTLSGIFAFDSIP